MQTFVPKFLGNTQRSFFRVMSRCLQMAKSDETVYSSNTSQSNVENGFVSEFRPANSEGERFEVFREGLASIRVPSVPVRDTDSETREFRNVNSQSVFYNPIQQFNRDLSVLAIRAFGEDLLANRHHRSLERRQQSLTKPNNSPKTRKRMVKDILDIRNEEKGDQDDSAKKPKYYEHLNDKHKAVSYDTQSVVAEDCAKSTTCHETSNFGASELKDGSFVQENLKEIKRAHVATPKSQKGASGLRILDALSATGLRAFRYATEIPFVSSVTANDISVEATNIIKDNVANNRLDHLINVVTGDATMHMYTASNESTKAHMNEHGKYDVIDLDPYGTAVPFLDAAMRALRDGGLLCVTCTDAAVWASCGYPEKTYSLYGGTPIKGLHSHEGGLRLILHAIGTAAARYGMSIEPLLSLSIDFYARVFVRVFKSAAEVKLLAGKTMLVYNCDSGCGAWSLQFLARNQLLQNKNGTSYYKHSLAQGPSSTSCCEHCGLKTHVSGPMYGGKLHNTQFLEAILSYLPEIEDSTYNTKARIEGVLSTAIEETLGEKFQDRSIGVIDEAASSNSRRVPRADPANIDSHPFFFIPSALSKVLHCSAPPEAALRGALIRAGYEVTRSHIKPNSIRTNAPWAFIWNVMREWVRQKAPIKDSKLKRGTAGWNILYGKGHADARESLTPTPQADEQTNTNPSASHMLNIVSNEFNQPIVFDEVLGRELKTKRLVRYQLNPRPNWGPINRARGY